MGIGKFEILQLWIFLPATGFIANSASQLIFGTHTGIRFHNFTQTNDYKIVLASFYYGFIRIH